MTDNLRVSDVVVKLTVSSPTAVTGLGNLMIITQTGASVPANATANDGLLTNITDDTTKSAFKTYTSLDALSKDYPSTTTVYKKAAAYFDQENASDRISVMSYATGKVEDSLRAFWNQDWTFAVWDGNGSTDTASATLADQTAAATLFEAQEDHILVLQREQASEFSSMTKGNDYTVGCVHSLAEPMDAALVGACASLTVGSITWKFKELHDVTPEDLTAGQVTAITAAHCIAYANVHGRAQTTEGTVLSGEYIDEIHGEMWVKVNLEANLESLLQSNPKVPYDATGIAMIQGVVTSTLQTATDQGIILVNDNGKGDFSVSSTPRSAQSATDLSSRHYAGCTFRYTPSGAVHTVEVNGVVDSTTVREK